jgi:hypothetical protein
VGKRAIDFSEEDKVKVLLWCARHCCLCGRACGVGIEVAHIDARGGNNIDNAIPLCFDCHTEIGHYNPNHPKGRKYNKAELKTRRNQVYEEHTRHLIPPLEYRPFQTWRNPDIVYQLPKVGFFLWHQSDSNPVRVRIKVGLSQRALSIGPPKTEGHYDGAYRWNLNPRQVYFGWFELPEQVAVEKKEAIVARIDVEVIDIYERSHQFLPVGFVIDFEKGPDWFAEPCSEKFDSGS